MAYASSSDYAEYMRFSSDFDTDSADEVLITNLLARAQKIIETRTKRVFQCSSSDDESIRYFDYGSDVDGYTLFLDEDLASITSITIGDSDGTTITAGSDYVTEPRNNTPYYAIKLKSSSPYSWTYDSDPESAIAVTGFWGYSTDPPVDIVHATIRLASWLDKQRKSPADLDRPALAGEGTIIMPTRLPADVAEIIETYKKRRVGGV